MPQPYKFRVGKYWHGCFRLDLVRKGCRTQYGLITIFAEYEFSDRKITGFSVNWSAIGSQEPEIAKVFGDGLKTAAKIAEKLANKYRGTKYELYSAAISLT